MNVHGGRLQKEIFLVSKTVLSEITLLLPDAVVIAELPDNVEAKLEMSC
jgi:hypothetical protein